jgi:hypothetical protein
MAEMFGFECLGRAGSPGRVEIAVVVFDDPAVEGLEEDAGAAASALLALDW